MMARGQHHSHDARGHGHGAQLNKNAWDKHCETYDRDSKDFVEKATTTMFHVLRNAGIPTKMHASMKVLDFGAGTGNLAVPLLERLCGEVTAVDVSKGMLEYARRKMEAKKLKDRFRIINAEITAENVKAGVENDIKKDPDHCLYVEKEGYDMVLCSMVIHHMPDMVAAIKMFKSMLKPNGLLFIYEFEATDKAKADALQDKEKSHGVFHAGLTPSTFMELMQAAGLKTLHSKHAFTFEFKDQTMDVLAGVAFKESSSRL